MKNDTLTYEPRGANDAGLYRSVLNFGSNDLRGVIANTVGLSQETANERAQLLCDRWNTHEQTVAAFERLINSVAVLKKSSRVYDNVEYFGDELKIARAALAAAKKGAE